MLQEKLLWFIIVLKFINPGCRVCIHKQRYEDIFNSVNPIQLKPYYENALFYFVDAADLSSSWILFGSLKVW